MLETDTRLEWKTGMDPVRDFVRSMAADDNTIRIQINEVCCALKCRDDDVYHQLQQLYSVFHTEQSPNITVELEATDRIGPEDLGKAVSKTKYVHDGKNRFRTTSKIVNGEYNLPNHYIKITGERNLGNPDSEYNHLNRLISLIYYSACKVKYNDIPPSMLVHACGILRKGQVLLFTGPSGAGKTTIARLCGQQHGEVINDETLLVSRPIDGINVRSAPFLGAFPPRRKVTAPLHSIMFLKQSNKTVLHRIERTEAYLKLMRQIITPAYIGQMDKRAILSLIADFSMEIISSIPAFELEFNLNKDLLWQVVGEAEEMVSKREQQ